MRTRAADGTESSHDRHDRPRDPRPLIALGRVRRRELTASELQAALPVDALDVPNAHVLVILELEEAGCSVEPDAFGPRAETAPCPG